MHKYAVHPGWITSKHDGQRHYIGIAALVRLYKIQAKEWIVWNSHFGHLWEDYIHLYPNYHGNYRLPD